MELGREFRAGDFPATPRAMIDAVRIEWRRLTLSDEDALFTFRTGRELHVITARGNDMQLAGQCRRCPASRS
jgi:hypothetical protein